MTLRCCIYKNCGNYINLKDRSMCEDVKLFSFPKNPERRQKWMELGKVPPNQPPSMYYFCSDHFDRKYLAVNNRRTALVGEAVPYPYIETEVDDTLEADTNLDYYLHIDKESGDIATKDQSQSDQDLHVESTTIQDELKEEFNEEHFSLNLDEQDAEECIIFTDDEKESNTTHISSLKRKLETDNTFTQASPLKSKTLKRSPKIKQLRTSFEKITPKSLQYNTNLKSPFLLSQTDRVNIGVTKKQEIDVDELIDAANVTTFIFKGEEYVQMPKEHYVREKIDLLKRIQKMEYTLKIIKEHVNCLDV